VVPACVVGSAGGRVDRAGEPQPDADPFELERVERGEGGGTVAPALRDRAELAAEAEGEPAGGGGEVHRHGGEPGGGLLGTGRRDQRGGRQATGQERTTGHGERFRGGRGGGRRWGGAACWGRAAGINGGADRQPARNVRRSTGSVSWGVGVGGGGGRGRAGRSGEPARPRGGRAVSDRRAGACGSARRPRRRPARPA